MSALVYISIAFHESPPIAGAVTSITCGIPPLSMPPSQPQMFRLCLNTFGIRTLLSSKRDCAAVNHEIRATAPMSAHLQSQLRVNVARLT